MTPERWKEVEDVLQGALDRPAQERASFLDQACAGDEDLKNEASSLIGAHDEAGDFIEQPAIAQDARLLVGYDSESDIGRDVGPYTIVERLGSGGMGEVFLARDARLNRLVALKILPAYFVSDEVRLRRFQREARAASALNHPNILTIHEVSEGGGTYYFATEFIDGHTIRELITNQELSLKDVLEIAEQVASALAAAHAAGIVHRDIKPENIMRRTDGLVKILDFGIAKLMEQELVEYSGETQPGRKAQTEAGLVMGTVNYMSPEQARGLPVDERTDLWSLGVVLYEMLAHRLPFKAPTRMDTMVAILERQPPALFHVSQRSRPQLRQLEGIVDKILRKDRNQRYQTANDLLADLKSITQDLDPSDSLTTPLTTFATQENRPVLTSSHPFLLLGIAVVLAVAIGGTVFFRPSIRSGPATSNGRIATVATAKLYSRMNDAEKLAFIDEQEQRISTMMGDRPVKLREDALRAIKLNVDRYAARTDGVAELGGESLNVVFARAKPYVPLIAHSFAARRVPIIIGIYLPMIESAYRNCYENSFGAKGLYQFLPETARSYGVAHQDMCDVEKMTPAAAHYLADRMAELGEDSQSVTLVLLSYNRGPEWVRNSLRELRGTDNYERNFWTLFAHRDQLDDTFRNENAWYVPNFFAAAIIGENPETFGLAMPPLSTLSH
ncbi:MAG: serine/threonine-protein kinase [Pyrinomonadaceae bacterium]